MASRRLADDVELELVYADTTRFGGIPSGTLGRTVQERCAPVFEHWQAHGGTNTIAASDALLSAALASALGDLYRNPGELEPDVLHPPANAIVPSALVLSRDGKEILRSPLTPALTRDLARWLGEWSTAAIAPRAAEPASLFERLDSVAAFTGVDVEPPALPPGDGHFVGHATVAFDDAAGGRVLVDPYLLPRSVRFPSQYQPIVARELDPLAAVCVTHCHPDHFSPGSLLRLGASTRIFVPRVEKESALSIGMAARLAELGFDRVEELGWHEERVVAGGRIVALPFFGEQPTTGARLHPDVRNQGNAYFIELGGKSYLTVADSGSDSEGDAKRLAESLRARPGFAPLDVLFGGYRAFPQYPIEYLASSVPEYLLFVPRDAWLQRQKIMYDADELIDLAEAWRARHVVPYACGGAPWYWQRGLGPVLDRAADEPTSRADPAPDEVVRAARWRTGPADEPRSSPVDVATLRPGDGFRLDGDRLLVTREDPHAWPFAKPALDAAAQPRPEAARSNVDVAAPERRRWVQLNVAVSGETDAAMRENAWRLFRRIAPVVTELKAKRRARAWFFQWKPPGFRIRVELDGPAGARGDPEVELSAELDRCVRIAAVDSYVSAIYEPEWRVFGGREAMDAVHRYFDVDTSLYIERLALARSTMPQPVCETISWLAFVLDDLTAHCVADAGECWDVYMRLLERHGIDDDGHTPPLPAGDLLLSRGETAFLHRYREEHQRLAEALERISNEGKLRVGLRSLVANVIQFQLNRHQLAPEEQHAVVRTLVRTRDPARKR